MVTIIKKALKESSIPPEPVSAVQDCLGLLNYPSFRRIVSYMTQQLGLVEDETVVKAIVSARNSLVHSGQFLSIKDPVKAKEFGFVDAGHEFLQSLKLCGPGSVAGCRPCGDVHELLGLLDEPLFTGHRKSAAALNQLTVIGGGHPFGSPTSPWSADPFRSSIGEQHVPPVNS